MNLKPSKEEGGADDAARSKSTDVQAILDDFRKINGAAAPVWSAEGWRLYHEWIITGQQKHLTAFKRHVSGIQVRLAGWRPKR